MSSPTRAAPQALTTPFVPPPSCANQFITTSFVSSSTTVTVLASGPADARFSACQPPGWDSGGESSGLNGFRFSPAVCPSGWTAYNLGGTMLSDVTTAYCCSSGFTHSLYWNQIDGISPTACFANISDTTAPTATASSALSPHGFRVHNAWHISWEASDIPSLSPTPPPFATCITSPVIRSWVPGATVEPDAFLVPEGVECNDGTSRWSKAQTASFFFLIVGLPTIILAIVVTCLVVCCCRRRRRVREGREREGGPWRLVAKADIAQADGDGVRTGGGPRPAPE
ncbi:hypothetical protein N658DRAFT_497447 [Parathielavia hyrcaniae]|uniref:Uncharacterized protein n=1 Tax=Parathielavia hyrcaniae TaxID=113614 RepID=A0AAN6PYL8_9PEZI|nr:hypothetical protein N658DRAFT_497447 [Parathielavia hyrcaniae]